MTLKIATILRLAKISNDKHLTAIKMSTQKISYSAIEKECIKLLDWLIEKIEAMEEAGQDIGPNGKKLSLLFTENKDRIEARALTRVRQAQELKRIDLTDTDRGLLKEAIEAGKKTDEKLVDIHAALVREKFKMLNWGKAAESKAADTKKAAGKKKQK